MCLPNKVQAAARGFAAKKKFRAIRAKIVVIQSWRRGTLGRRYAEQHHRHVSACKIQAVYKRWQDRRVYAALKSAILLAQQRFRLVAAKKQMQKLKKEAKEVGALMAKSQKAHEQASELRRRNDELEAGRSARGRAPRPFLRRGVSRRAQGWVSWDTARAKIIIAGQCGGTGPRACVAWHGSTGTMSKRPLTCWLKAL